MKLWQGSMHNYQFSTLKREDLPILYSWLCEDHVRAFWGNPDEELALIDAEFEFNKVEMCLVSINDQPFAYVQGYPVRHWPIPQYASLPEGSFGVDTFIGKPDYLGQGHASAYLRQFADKLIEAGASAVVVDPETSNQRAQKSYFKAGFRPQGKTIDEKGNPIELMLYRPQKNEWNS